MNLLFIGLGRTGLPQALIFANAGFKVYGLDSDASVVQSILRSEVPFHEEKMASYLKKSVAKTFFPVASWGALDDKLHLIDAVFFTVGTPVLDDRGVLKGNGLDISLHFTILDRLFSRKDKLKKGLIIVFRTTFPLGATDTLTQYIQKQYALKESKDFYIAFVPERITVGSAIYEGKSLPKIIGTYSDAAFAKVSKIFQKIGGKLIKVRNPITAEFCKLTDNSFRSTLFGYANELAMYAGCFDIDVDEVIDSVNESYHRNSIPKPGFVSGYCLGKDPYMFELDFAKNSDDRDFHSIWYYGRKTNDYLAHYVTAKILKHTKKRSETCIAVLGLSYKKDCDDFRMSHAFDIMRLLIHSDIRQFKVYDRNINKNKYAALAKDIEPYVIESSSALDQDFLRGVDVIIICNPDQFLLKMGKANKLMEILSLTNNACYIYDTYDVWRQAEKPKHIAYECLGFTDNSV